ncbi:uncharacterized protein H6S33_000951 [Morchella sextelata]|uniref:uncharacterized protein n=1 Tax=Morchella sextelata TaxID=1174677 RepID=UPI001D037445|nr:uncharacterized protein H6S33_000951 [Morchella sextelata]KAH0615315.1 hypothetical protein H6S33_000951 [Morchella sextelata]
MKLHSIDGSCVTLIRETEPQASLTILLACLSACSTRYSLTVRSLFIWIFQIQAPLLRVYLFHYGEVGKMSMNGISRTNVAGGYRFHSINLITAALFGVIIIEQHNLGQVSAKKRMAQLLFYFSAKVTTFIPCPLVAVLIGIASKF